MKNMKEIIEEAMNDACEVDYPLELNINEVISKRIATKLTEAGYVKIEDVVIDEEKLCQILDDYLPPNDLECVEKIIKLAKHICDNKDKIIKVKNGIKHTDLLRLVLGGQQSFFFMGN